MFLALSVILSSYVFTSSFSYFDAYIFEFAKDKNLKYLTIFLLILSQQFNIFVINSCIMYSLLQFS